VKNEAETRSDHIDPMLVAAGWGVTPGSRIRREYPITLGRLEGNGKRGKALSADYVLEYRNTKLAVVEAKAWDKPLTPLYLFEQWPGYLCHRHGDRQGGGDPDLPEPR